MLRRIAFGIVLAFLAVAGMLFTALNQQVFDVDIAFATFEVSSGLALLIAFSAGLLAGAFVRSRWVADLLAERGRLRHALRLAEGRFGEAKVSPASATAPPTPTLATPTPTSESTRTAATATTTAESTRTTATPTAGTKPTTATPTTTSESTPTSVAPTMTESTPTTATPTPTAGTTPTITTPVLSR